MRRSEARWRHALLAACIAAGGVLATAPSIAADGKALYAACIACHGARGEGVTASGAPALAGLQAWYLERQLAAFASGMRGKQAGDTFGATMSAAVATLHGDQDRSAVSAYLAGLPAARAAAVVTATDNGRNYFNAICSACHAANGLGNQALGAPRLAGMDPTYLARQLAAFKSGVRGGAAADRFGGQMRVIAAMLPDAKTEHDVIQYAVSLKP